MNKTQKILGICAAAGLGLGAGFLFMTAPGRPRPGQFVPFRGRYFAHRGLHDQLRPENSLAAFRAAAAGGYAVELDVRLSHDGVPVVIHDEELYRMTGRSGNVRELDWPQLQQLRLRGTQERIPRLKDALDILCSAGVPVIVELKPSPRRRELCRRVLEVLDRYDAPLCVESFDPWIVGWFRRHAPEILRGQLVASAEELELSRLRAFFLSRGLFNFIGRPQFIAHSTTRRSLPIRLAYRLGAMRVAWTARDRNEERRSDAVIFEGFLPPVHYR